LLKLSVLLEVIGFSVAIGEVGGLFWLALAFLLSAFTFCGWGFLVAGGATCMKAKSEIIISGFMVEVL